MDDSSSSSSSEDEAISAFHRAHRVFSAAAAFASASDASTAAAMTGTPIPSSAAPWVTSFDDESPPKVDPFADSHRLSPLAFDASSLSKPALPPRPFQSRSILSGGGAVETVVKPPLPSRPSRDTVAAFSSLLSPAGVVGGSAATSGTSGSGSVGGRILLETCNAGRSVPASRLFVSEVALTGGASSSGSGGGGSGAAGKVLCLASSRGYLVTGHVSCARVWNLLSGECSATITRSPLQASASTSAASPAGGVDSGGGSGGDLLRVTSIAFLPSRKSRDFDSRLFWIGWSDGALWMADLFTGQVHERRLSAHSHAVSHIVRLDKSHVAGDDDSVCSLDDNGVLQCWSDVLPAQVRTPLFSSGGGSSGSDSAPVSSLYIGHVVSLDGRPRTLRVDAGIVAVCVVRGGEVWCALDRAIEIVCPRVGVQSLVKDRLAVPGSLGAILCLAAVFQSMSLPSLSSSSSAVSCDYVYSGHADGKILEWDVESMSRKRLFDAGSYRVMSMAALSPELLLICTGTGKVIVMDIMPSSSGNSSETSDAVPVVKEWIAERKDGIDHLYVDVDSLIHSGELVVVGCSSKSGRVHVWDALFPDDFSLAEMRKMESMFCTYQDISLLICSWNVDASKPEHLLQRADDSYFIDKWVTTVPEGADIIAFGLQEIIDLESKSVAAKGLWKKRATGGSQQQQLDNASRVKAWHERLSRALKDNFKHNYRMVESRNMVGIFACVFVREQLFNRLSHCETFSIETGMGGTYGNKGAVLIRMCLDSSSFCFIVTHLPAHQNKVSKRNVDALTIIKSTGFSEFDPDSHSRYMFVRGGDGSQVLDHENIFFFGDLNYRIDLDRQLCIDLIQKDDIAALIAADQLRKQRQMPNSTCILRLFQEAPIAFVPTYKYDPGSDVFDSSEKKRSPAFCDRVLFRDSVEQTSSCYVNRGHRPNTRARIVPSIYKRFECRLSDHRPIAAAFTVQTKNIVDHNHKLSQTVALVDDRMQVRKNEINWDACCRWICARTAAEQGVVEGLLRQHDNDLNKVI
eukprot:Partr_v1_DN28077_c0_g1_i1_m57693 putative Synaptojanin